MSKTNTFIGAILFLGILGCGGYQKSTTTQQGEVKEESSAPQQEGVASSMENPSQTIPVSQTTLKVDGMTCGGCEFGVKKCLLKLDGVKEANVSYEKGEALVQYDPEKVTKEKMVDVINKIGFKASLP